MNLQNKPLKKLRDELELLLTKRDDQLREFLFVEAQSWEYKIFKIIDDSCKKEEELFGQPSKDLAKAYATARKALDRKVRLLAEYREYMYWVLKCKSYIQAIREAQEDINQIKGDIEK